MEGMWAVHVRTANVVRSIVHVTKAAGTAQTIANASTVVIDNVTPICDSFSFIFLFSYKLFCILHASGI